MVIVCHFQLKYVLFFALHSNQYIPACAGQQCPAVQLPYPLLPGNSTPLLPELWINHCTLLQVLWCLQHWIYTSLYRWCMLWGGSVALIKGTACLTFWSSANIYTYTLSFWKGDCQGSLNGGAEAKRKSNWSCSEKDKGGADGVYSRAEAGELPLALFIQWEIEVDKSWNLS